MPVNALLVRWGSGWGERTDATSIAAHTRTEATLGLGALASRSAMERVADGQLSVYRNPREQVDAGIEPSLDADTPYIGYRVGDVVTVEGVAQRVVSITVSFDSDGRAVFNPTFNDVILGQQERFAQAIKKMINGTLRGDSKVAQPVASPKALPPNCCVPQPPESS